MGGGRRADLAIVVPMVAFVKIVVELHTYFWEGGAKGHNCSRAGYRYWMCVPWPRRSSRRILLHVHVSFLATAHPTTVRWIHHGSAAIIERCPHSASSEQLSVSTSFQIIVHGVVLGTVSSSVPILFCHEAKKSDNMVVANQPAWSQQIGGFHSIVQAF